ncbi:MAG: glycerate kinase [Planctomycetaceae bacterium]|nr:glycerate kinase [Planctomycetaceae bacterium]
MDDVKKLREDALAIWRAGVDAVRSEQLVAEHVAVRGERLYIGGDVVELAAVRRIVVIGAGKAGAGMAVGLETALGEALMADKELQGWVNVPADCLRPTSRITLHAARPAGINEPTKEGVSGAETMLRMVRSLGDDDVCVCLLSGGASALLPAPISGLTLQDKQAVTRLLSGAGATIHQLNTVRKQLSRVKGGRLAAACRAGVMKTLIISDVIGDPLEIIASGPTVRETSTPREVTEVFGALRLAGHPVVRRIVELLKTRGAVEQQLAFHPEVTNTVIGNNQIAVDAAGCEASRRGYITETRYAEQLEGAAEDVGRDLAQAAVKLRSQSGERCLISGGEPTVTLVEEARRGRGGRNQQLVLAGLHDLCYPEDSSSNPAVRSLDSMVLLSGGTDGEDGPTDAAGALADAAVVKMARSQGLRALDYLDRNDAYHFFVDTGGLIVTGPTHTNVCDVRVALTAKPM